MKVHGVLSALLSFSVLTAGCSYRPKYEVRKFYDEFQDFTTFELDGNFLGGNDDYEVVQLNISVHISKNREVSYALSVIYTASSRLNIEKGESLVMLIDGERVAFAALDSADSRTNQGYGSSYGKILEIEQSLRYTEPVQVASNDDNAVLYATGYGRSYRHNYNYGHGYGYHS